MKHLVGIGALVAIAFVLRFWLHTGLGLDITIHDTYRVGLSQGHRLLVSNGNCVCLVPGFCLGIHSSPFLISPGKADGSQYGPRRGTMTAKR
jgi:hypothetical protein